MIAVTHGEKIGFRPPHRASVIGLWLVLAALGMLFVSSMWLYILMRLHVFGRITNEPIRMPVIAWGSTVVLLVGSFTAHRAVTAIRRERLGICLKYLYITSALAVLFLIVQSPCMAQVLGEHRQLAAAAGVNKGPGEFAPVSLYGLVFVLILLHALHVLGGIVAPGGRYLAPPGTSIRSRKLHGRAIRGAILAFPGYCLDYDVHDVSCAGVIATPLRSPSPRVITLRMSILSEIQEHNVRFVERREYEPFLTDAFPDKKLVVLTCMDTRLVELLPRAMNIRNGDAKIIKNAGAIVSHPFGSVMRSLLVAVYELNAVEVAVVGHYGCGMTKLSCDRVLQKAVARGVSPSDHRIPPARGDRPAKLAQGI